VPFVKTQHPDSESLRNWKFPVRSSPADDWITGGEEVGM
jgi:hypothetical protein